MGKFLRKLGKVVGVRIDFSSLQFRLTLGIIIIFVLELSSLIMWTDWEIKHFLINSYQQQNLSDDYIRLLEMRQSLGAMSILSISTTIAIAALFIRRSLLPLRQMNRWAETHATEPSCYPLGLEQTPSEVKAIAQTWNRLLTRLSEVRKQQQQFTNDLAHELRTPLSLVYGYLQRTQQRRQQLTDFQQEALAMAVSEAARMVQLLQDLLNLARSGTLQMESLILNDLLIEVAEMTEKFERRTIQLQIPGVPLRVEADRNQLIQVLIHLLGNALKYSDASEPVTVHLIQSEGWAAIQVSDRGCGIPMSQQSRIFDPFYRVDPSRTRSTGGAGLGLSLAQHLLENMRGKITVQSEPGKGSTFILRLPILGAKP